MASRVKISKRLVLVNSVSSMAAMGINLVVLVWLQQYLLKRLSPEEYSLLPVLFSVMAFAPLLTNILTGGIGRYVTIAYAQGDDEKVTTIVSTMLPLLILSAAVFFLVGCIFSWYINSILNIGEDRLWDARVMMLLMVFSITVQLPAAAFRSGFIIKQKLVLQDTINIGCQFLRIGLLFFFLFGISTSVIWVVTATVISELINVIITIPISVGLVPAQRFKRSHIQWGLVKELTSFGGWSTIGGLAYTIRNSIDPIILNVFATPVGIACFHIASLPGRQFVTLTAPLARPIIPILAAFEATGDLKRMRNTHFRISRYAVWVVFLFATPGLIYANEFIELYIGGIYSDASSVMIILLISLSTHYANFLTPAIALARNAVKGLAIREFLIHGANVGLTLIFVSHFKWGAIGCALATLCVSLLLQPLLMWPYIWRLLKARPAEWVRMVVIPGFFPTLITSMFLIILKYFFKADTWFKFLSCSFFGGAVYCVILFSFCLQDQDRQDLCSLKERLFQRKRKECL